ncbi:MAG: RHS repeat-associated core domain-containing protein [Gemmatimonadales bacterium]
MFDALNRVAMSIRWVDSTVPIRTETTYLYEDSLHLTKVIDAKGQVYSYLYNAVGWLIRETDPVGRRDTFAYAVNGDLLSHTNRNNKTVTYTYDLLHRPTQQAGTATVNWIYGNGGFRVVAVSAQARDSTLMNALGKPTFVRTSFAAPTSVSFDRHYRYTSAGLLDSLRVERVGGGVTFRGRKYIYDTSKGLLDTVRLGGEATVFLRDGNLADTSRAFPGGGSAKTTYGAIHAPLKMTSSAGYASIIERWIGLDSLGRVEKHLVQNAEEGRFYTYDWLGRLKVSAYRADTSSAPPPGVGCPEPNFGLLGTCFTAANWATLGVPDSFKYDRVGNRTDKGGTYGTGNRIQFFGGCNYTTDSTGNVRMRRCGADTTQFFWASEGQLTSVSATGKPTFTYHYDAMGRLVRRDTATTTPGPDRYFLWDGDNLLAELNGNATAKLGEYSYYPGLDNLHAMIVPGSPVDTVFYAHHDGLGNVIQLSRGTTVRRTYNYTDWGVLSSGLDSNFAGRDRARWKGALWLGPDTTLYYMRNRWYEAGTGRFLSEDPLGLAGGLNPVTFGETDPVNRSDPSGLVSCSYNVFFWEDTKELVYADVFCDAGYPADLGRDSPGGLLRDIIGDPKACSDALLGLGISIVLEGTGFKYGLKAVGLINKLKNASSTRSGLWVTKSARRNTVQRLKREVAATVTAGALVGYADDALEFPFMAADVAKGEPISWARYLSEQGVGQILPFGGTLFGILDVMRCSGG